MIPRPLDYLTIPSDAMGVDFLHVDAARRLIKLREVGSNPATVGPPHVTTWGPARSFSCSASTTICLLQECVHQELTIQARLARTPCLSETAARLPRHWMVQDRQIT